MLSIHPDARTTPAVRAEIARSSEPTGELARRFGVSTETVRKWRKRGVADCRDRSSRPHKLRGRGGEGGGAVVGPRPRPPGSPWDAPPLGARPSLPPRGRDNVSLTQKGGGLGRGPAPATPEKAA